MKRSSVDRVLDATAEVVQAVGVKRTTISAIARAAGMARATVYTHVADVDAAVAALLTRELGAVLDRAVRADGGRPGDGRPDDGRADDGRAKDGGAGDGRARDGCDGLDGRARLVRAVGEVLDRVPEHPLFRKVLEVDPEVLLPYLVQRLGAVQSAARDTVAVLVADGQADGSVRSGDPALLAHVICTTVQAFLVGHRLGDDVADRAVVVGCVADLLDDGLRPLAVAS